MDGNDTDRAIHEWISSSQFQKPDPEQLVAAVHSALQASNEEFSSQCGVCLQAGMRLGPYKGCIARPDRFSLTGGFTIEQLV